MMAIDSEQDAHTRHVGTAWRTQSDGNAGAVKAARPHGRSKRAFDLSHQTLAAWPETRRGSAETGGRAADAWRSGARRPDRNAGREPKGASFRLLLLVLAIDAQQLHHRRRRTTGKREMEISSTERKKRDTVRRGKSGSAAGAVALPLFPGGERLFFGNNYTPCHEGALNTSDNVHHFDV
ncbi:hypothetical protein [Klebsiella sp. WP3-S18-ESBL-05]|uniref:hypothetical protein n=1 Tax=Klebsiella sp. WP3-S18-ESBL-05 TaxID=2675711 RepID=UPI001602E473|nr:hypothetical protein [Klebsiella sp. WP3-S18-ESBL-05]